MRNNTVAAAVGIILLSFSGFAGGALAASFDGMWSGETEINGVRCEAVYRISQTDTNLLFNVNYYTCTDNGQTWRSSVVSSDVSYDLRDGNIYLGPDTVGSYSESGLTMIKVGTRCRHTLHLTRDPADQTKVDSFQEADCGADLYRMAKVPLVQTTTEIGDSWQGNWKAGGTGAYGSEAYDSCHGRFLMAQSANELVILSMSEYGCLWNAPRHGFLGFTQSWSLSNSGSSHYEIRGEELFLAGTRVGTISANQVSIDRRFGRDNACTAHLTFDRSTSPDSELQFSSESLCPTSGARNTYAATLQRLN